MDTKPLTFIVEQDSETGWFSASWDDPNGGGITTQAKTLADLPSAIDEAIRCHFLDRPAPLKSAPSFPA
jgi:predicted RNase H-like HicB family nuclease